MIKLFGESLIDQMTGVDGAQAMSESQVQRESGGRQFEADGKTPLVGRYRDGTTPVPSKRAYGVAQMQIGTGKNVAAAHGVPWDETKFMNDAKYNKLLGDYHMNDLERRYGNKTIAEAAYHSGERIVDNAILKYGRENFHLGLGPEGRAYIGRGSGGGGSRTSGAGSRPTPNIADTKATPAELASIQNMSGQVYDPFAAAPRVGAAAKTQTERASVAEQVLNAAVEKSNAVRQQEMDALSTTVTAKDALIDHQKDITNQAIERTTPIFQKRQAIADRMVEIQEMNPLERTFKSIFNPNYNVDYLEGSDRNYARQLDAVNSAYAQDFQMHQTLTNLSQADFDNQDQLFKLQLANSGQDIQNAVMSWQSAGRMLQSEIEGLGANTATIAAQTQARNDIYNGLTDGQLNDLVGKAGTTGVTTVNGVDLRLPELLQIRSTRQEQAMSLEARGLALQAQNLALAENLQDKVLGTMSQPQIEEAIKAGGVFQGQQFDLGKLGQALQQRQGMVANQVQGQMVNDAAAAAGDMLMGFANQANAYKARAMAIFGKVPDEYNATDNMIASQLRAFTAGIKKAQESGTEAQYIAANMPTIAGLITANNKAVDDMAKKWAGGNQYAEATARAWIKGEPLDSGAAMRGMIHFARNGLPAGTKLDQLSSSVFSAVQDEVRKDDTAHPNDPISFMTPDGNKGDKAQREQDLIERVQKRIGGVYNSQFVTQIQANAPAYAKHVMVNGKPHQASLINIEDWRGAIQRGDQAGREERASALGMKTEAYLKMLRDGPNSQDAKSRNVDLATEQRALVAAQNRAAMTDIDKHRDEYGFRPSQAITNLWNNPQFLQMTENQAQIAGKGTFGGFLTSSASGGTVHNAVQNFAEGWSVSYNVRRENIAAIKTQRSNELAYDPVSRAKYMLGAVDGFSPQDEQLLLDAIKTRFSGPMGRAIDSVQGATKYGAFQCNSESPIDRWQNSEIDSFILHGKFDDPHLEQLRKKAASQWPQIGQVSNGIFSRMIGD